ncbi:protein NO VEIN domain-containing protein [Natronorubrum bangense]|nr:DUF3883 domain-containing protein [Natronorubrum bangense]
MEASNPDQLVRRIREQYLADSPDLVRTSLHGHSNVVQMNFASTYFPLEFIQNADDEGASAVRFQVRQIDGDWCLEILNNGRKFTDSALEGQDRDTDDVKDDVTGLCAAGVSPKHPRDHIGFIGVGFKSIFEISQCVEVHSGQFHFSFDRERAEKHGDEIPWRVVPWECNATKETEVPAEIDGTEYTTRFVVRLDERGRELLSKDELFEPLHSENIDRRVFLFLKDVRELSIEDHYSDNSRHISRTDDVRDDGLASSVERARQQFPSLKQKTIRDEADAQFDPIEVVELEESLADGTKEADTWVLFKHLWEVPDSIQEDPKTEQYMRGGVDYREVFIACIVDDDGGFARPESGTLHTGVFSYLPLKELETDFDFLVHADFLTPADRQTIKQELPWNREIAQGVVECAKDVLDVVAGHDDWWTDLGVFVPEGQGDTFVTTEIVNRIHEYVESSSLVRDQAGQRIKLDDCQVVDEHIGEAFDADQVEEAGADRPIHEEHEEIYQTIESRKSLGIHQFLQNYDVTTTLEGVAGVERTNTFERVFEGISSKASFRQSNILSTTAVPLEDGRVVGTDDVEQVYLPPTGIDLDEFETARPLQEVRSSLNIVDSDLAEKEEIRSVLDKNDVEELTEGALIEEWLQTVEWDTLTTNDRYLVAAILCRASSDGEWEVGEDPPTLRLQTEDGSWLSPSQLLLGEAYGPTVADDTDAPTQNLQAAPWFTTNTVIENRGIFAEAGADALRTGPRYVSEAYLETFDELGVDDWRPFLRKLGVDSMVNEKHTIGALGELFVKLQLEAKQDVDVRQAKIGRDLDVGSINDPDGQIVEVKSTKESKQDFDLNTTQTQLLEAESERYRVYRVTEVLSTDPIVRYADAETARSAGTFKLEFSSSDWQRDSITMETRTSY